MDKIVCDQLNTSRLRLIGFNETFITERYVSWLNNPSVVQYSNQRFMRHTVSTCGEYWNEMSHSGNACWAIVLRDTGSHIGNITTVKDLINNVTDIRMLIGEVDCWGKGLGLEAFGAVIGYLFDKTEVRKVTAGTLSCNIGMNTIMLRSGMKPDGVRNRHCLIDGEEMDMEFCAIFRDEYNKEEE